jgi:hypothetical protein
MMTGHQRMCDVHYGSNDLFCSGMFGKKKQLGFPQASPGKVETGKTPSPNDPLQVLVGLTHTKNILTIALAQSKRQLLPSQVIVDASRLLREIEKEVRQIRNEFAIQVHGLEGVKVKFVFDTNLGSLAVHADRFADALSAVCKKPGIDKASVIFVSWDGHPPHMLKLMKPSAGETTMEKLLEFEAESRSPGHRLSGKN